MYRIGEFSYLFRVSVKTLLHYEKKGIFMPSYIDPFTGYRYYKEEQREEFWNILKLKELGFHLEEIKELKDHLPPEKIKEKIEELQNQKQKLNKQIQELEKLRKDDDVPYEIGLTFSYKFTCLGYSVHVKKRDETEEEKILEEISKKLTKLKINHHTKAILEEEVGFKTEDVDLFIGYAVVHNALRNEKMRKKAQKLGLEEFSYPTGTYLVALDIGNSKRENVCSSMVDYANRNHIQILGPFIEHYEEDGEVGIYTFAHPLNLPKDIVIEKRERERIRRLEQTFSPNPKVLGTWQIREILPNILFDPAKHKANLDTTYQEFQFFEDGTTNYDNVRYNGNCLIISYRGRKTYNYMRLFQTDGKEYLEIGMSELSLIYEDACPITYIYERK